MRFLKFILFLCFLTGYLKSFATHNRSGEITYEWLGSGQYKIIITTYTKYSGFSAQADKCEETAYIRNLSATFIDSVVCLRTNGTSPCSGTPGAMMGEILDPGVNDYKKNEYTAIVSLNSGATYIFYVYIPNRNLGIININGASDQQPFALADTIRTYNLPGLTVNSTPVLLNPPIDVACHGRPFIHNPGAYDANGDSLSYDLSIIYGGVSDQQILEPVPGYIGASNYGITIDHVTGDFLWPYPDQLGEYNFGILITEWRKTADGDYVKMGSILRDLQVKVVSCSNNPPQITEVPDTCILAGSSYLQNIVAVDPDNNAIVLTATGGPFETTPPAIFNYNSGSGTVTGQITWSPSCSDVRNQPYLVTIKAKDNDPIVSLVDYESFLIKVVPPPPENFTVTPLGTNMVLNWSRPTLCSQTSGNIIVAYHIYRKSGCQSYTPSPCETGVPASWGFTQIGSVNAIGVTSPNFTFSDNNNGAGLAPGLDYSYIVVAYFADGSNSLASDIVCGKLVRDVPLITNVSVDTTDLSVGQMYVRWAKPVIKSGSLDGFDTTAYPGPYEFRLLQSSGAGSTPITQVYSVSHTYFAQFNTASDTSAVITLLNTQNNQYKYIVQLYSGGALHGSSQTATSIWLKATGFARRIQLDWSYSVPWTNDSSLVYKQNVAGGYDLIATTTQKTYTDTGLVNGHTYCYKIETIGKYSDPTVASPLVNWSEKVCAEPVDKEAPCQPTVNAAGDCETQITSIDWQNGAPSCSYDIVSYNLYYTPFKDSTFILIESFPNTVMSFVTDYASSIAGCYAVTAVDSFGNESSIVDQMCVDNCPEYELPNIITINGDSINDFFIPIKNKFVKDIDLNIYNRWGTLVYHTTDPAIHWDGTNLQNRPCVTGTYFYICDVYIIRYTGIETVKLKGFLQIVRN